MNQVIVASHCIYLQIVYTVIHKMVLAVKEKKWKLLKWAFGNFVLEWPNS